MASARNFKPLVEFIRQTAHGKTNRSYRARFGTSDITQECAIQLINEFRKSEFQNDENTIKKSWLRKICLGHAAKLRRKNDAACRAVASETLPATPAIASQPSPDELAILNELSGKLVFALGGLSNLERKIIDGHYRKQLSLNQIAQEFGMSSKAIQRAHTRALEQLRECIAQDGS